MYALMELCDYPTSILLYDSFYLKTDAYGALVKDGVPPNSVVDVDVELVSWKRVEDVAGEGAVSKKILTSSSEWKSPNEGSTVRVQVLRCCCCYISVGMCLE